jgi:predicted enzyme related to lactoylglutathione lyase
VYGCTIEVVGDTPEFRYAQIMGDGEGVAGIMDASEWLPEGVPAHWSVYFTVESADATVAQAIELGGALVDGPDDTPYGRLVTLTDSTGARFKLVQNNQ